MCLIFVALVLSLGLGVFAPRMSQEICITDLDCGSDVGGTDIMDVKSRGYPFISRKTEITRKYVKNSIDSIRETKTTYKATGIALNTIFWSILTVSLFSIVKLRRRNENYRY